MLMDEPGSGATRPPEDDRRLHLLETMRLQAAHRADAARGEATAARARAEAESLARQAADSALIELRSAATHARVDAARLLREVRAHAAAQLHQAQAHAASMAQEVQRAHLAVEQIRASTAWRITGPARRLAGRLPPGLRRGLRGTAKMLWWTVTWRLGQRLRQRRLILDEVARQAAMAQDTPAPTPILVPLIDPGIRAEAVDIVICVHNALADVRACIASVIRCTLPPYRVIIVDDGSGAETARFLDAQAEEQGFLLLRNAEAGGYTRAANVGLRAVTAPWVVLLNSDTIVTMNWLERLWAHGARDPGIGVVGPLSNTASWQSVPRIFDPSETGREEWAENPLPPGIGIDDVGEMAASLGGGAAPLPFLNGFCYMIRGALLQSVGLFDEETFGAGYGEENDYSIRVRRAGFSLAVATDVYVYHAQSKSYSQDRRLTLARRADELLMQKFDAPTEIWPQAGFCRDNLGLASVRAHMAALWRRHDLVREGRARFEGKRIAFILPITELGGGGNVVIQESLALARMGVDVTLLNLDHNQRSLGALPDPASPLMRAFPSTEAMTAYLMANDTRYDAVIATLYRSVFWLPVRAACKLGYYVQDFEPNFFAGNELEQKSALLSYALDESICLLTKTRWNQSEVARHIGREPRLVGPSVDVMAFAPSLLPRPAGIVRITAMVRPSTPRRAPERTIDVLATIVAAFGDRVAVEIFGADDAQLEAAGLSRPWAVNAGRLNQAELATVLARADIFLDCSHYQAMGLTALEAMASGCAVIAPLVGGANDFIEGGINGFLVDTTDETACADAVAALVHDAARLASVQRRAIEDAHRYLPEAAALNLMTELFR
jgi:GT2 family glycosyltransferase/glycosyltransferase involved in cell wall biosynthesis